MVELASDDTPLGVTEGVVTGGSLVVRGKETQSIARRSQTICGEE